jgi:hypothetical protein
MQDKLGMRDNFSRMVSLNGSGWLRSTHSNKQLSAIATARTADFQESQVSH